MQVLSLVVWDCAPFSAFGCSWLTLDGFPEKGLLYHKNTMKIYWFWGEKIYFWNRPIKNVIHMRINSFLLKGFPKLVSKRKWLAQRKRSSCSFGGTTFIWARVHRCLEKAKHATQNTELDVLDIVAFYQNKSVLKVPCIRHDKWDLDYTARSCWEFQMNILDCFHISTSELT